MRTRAPRARRPPPPRLPRAAPGVEVAPPAAERLAVDRRECTAQRLRLRAELARDPVRLRVRALDERLVAKVGRACGNGACGRHVAPPRPGRTARLARMLELFAPLRLDPEPCMRAVPVTCVVAAFTVGTQPSPFEQGADDVPAVADHVHRARKWIRVQRSLEHERRLGRLLDAAQPACEPERPHPVDDRAELAAPPPRRADRRAAAAPPSTGSPRRGRRSPAARRARRR